MENHSILDFNIFTVFDLDNAFQITHFFLSLQAESIDTVCPGSISDPPEKIFNIFALENEVYKFTTFINYYDTLVIS